jgi:tetratricopeptide (TPR) repeat protein
VRQIRGVRELWCWWMNPMSAGPLFRNFESMQVREADVPTITRSARRAGGGSLVRVTRRKIESMNPLLWLIAGWALLTVVEKSEAQSPESTVEQEASPEADLPKEPQSVEEMARTLQIDPALLRSKIASEHSITEAERHQLDQTVRELNEMIQDDPEDAYAYRLRADAQEDLGEFAKALSDYDTAILLDPTDAETFSNRGDLFCEIRRYDRAFADFDRAIQLNPNEPALYINRGVAHSAKGDYDAAIADYDSAIKLGSKRPEIYANRALARVAKGEMDNALADFDRAIELAPDDGRNYGERGNTYLTKKEYEKAIADYKKAIELRPSAAGIHNNLAWVLATCAKETLRNGAEAVEHATTAVALDQGKQPTFFGTAAAAFAETGNFDEAVRWQQKLLANILVPPQAEKDRLALYKSRRPYHAGH